MLSLHDNRDEAVTAARRHSREEGHISAARTPAMEIPRPPLASHAAVRYEVIDALVVVRIAGPELTESVCRAVTEGFPREAHVVLLDVSCVQRLQPSQVVAIGRLLDEIELTGRQIKVVNPVPEVAETLRSAGRGSDLFWMRERRRPSPPAGG